MAEDPVLKFDPERAIPHPLDVKPWGNIWLSGNVKEDIKLRRDSLGCFGLVTEELFLEILSFCDSADLLTLSAVSLYCRAFSFHQDLWKDLFFAAGSDLNFKNSWRETFFSATIGAALKVRNVYSDLLFGPYRASGLTPTAVWLEREINIERVSYREMSVEQFVEKYEKRNKPVIITDFVFSEWKEAVENWTSISSFSARNNPQDPTMDCGPVSMRLSEFEQYAKSDLCKLDESPFFVFDTKNFSSSCSWLKDLPTPIPYFAKDLFDLLQGESRPDHKWILIGSAGASSKWHVDPNATNAWNAVIFGEKKWILVPPHSGPPPGVEVSSDSFAVRQPLTLTEWLDSGFYNDLLRTNSQMVEATCRSGEIMFVPRGWWHCVRNTAPMTLAVTQNYAAESSVDHVRRFLREKSHCVSGVPPHRRPSLWKEFEKALEIERPDLVSHAEEKPQPLEEEEESCFSFWDRLGSKQLSFQR